MFWAKRLTLCISKAKEKEGDCVLVQLEENGLRRRRQSGETNLSCTASAGSWVDTWVVVFVAKLVYLGGIKTMYTSNQFKPYIVVTAH